MIADALRTKSAGTERAGTGELEASGKLFGAGSLVRKLLDSFPGPAVVLNQYRQIVLANHKLAQWLDKPPEELLGLRPGEALDCIHAHEELAGCGTSEFCRVCGAAHAIVTSQEQHTPSVQECRITTQTAQGPGSLDLRVWATPLPELGEYTVFALRDISDEKRRDVLQRVFFHDVLNDVGGVRGLLDLLQGEAAFSERETCQMASDLLDQVIEEIQSARDLWTAEQGDLRASFQNVDAEVVLRKVIDLYSHHLSAAGKHMASPTICGPKMIHTDPVLLHRILGNLIKNALEASEPGQTVTVTFRNWQAPAFTVHNQGVMSEDAKLQVFQRSFTTKDGNGRGTGTYSVRLLAERYLGGSVGFTSSVESGTTFRVTLPPHPPFGSSG